MAQYCGNCGKKVDESWNICPECGANLKDEVRSQFQPVQYQPAYQPIQEPQTYSRPQYQPQPTVQYPSKPRGNMYGTGALIMGILGFCVCGIIFGIIAIILGAIGRTKDETPGLATGGLVLGIIDFVCGIVLIIFLLPLVFFPIYS